jgi:chromosome partitioning protein
MAYTVAITNQKGGVGKTTTAVNLAASLAVADRRTLLVDADPQGNTTSGVGIAKQELQVSLYDVLVEGHPAQDVILRVPGLRQLSLLPASQDLVGAELQLVERPFRESALRRVLEPLEREYDYIVVDCPPSLGLLTLNVLAAVQSLIIPIQCEYYGLEGISQLLNTVRLVQQNINPGLAIAGVLLTMYDSRLNLCRQVAEDATEYFGGKVFGTPIPRNVRLAEAPSFGKPILLYDMQSVGAKSYLAVGQELLRRVEGENAPVIPASVVLPAESPAPAESVASGEIVTAEMQELERHSPSAWESEPQGSEARPEETMAEEAMAQVQPGDTLASDTPVSGGVAGDAETIEADQSVASDLQAEENASEENASDDTRADFGGDGRAHEAQVADAQVVESPESLQSPSLHNPDTIQQGPEISELDDQGRAPKPSSEPLPEVTT